MPSGLRRKRVCRAEAKCWEKNYAECEISPQLVEKAKQYKPGCRGRYVVLMKTKLLFTDVSVNTEFVCQHKREKEKGRERESDGLRISGA